MNAQTSQVAIIGAGFGGLGMAVALKQAGIDFVVFEKNDDVGGIWRDNTYPGCGCDVPSHLYSFSFSPYRDSTVRFPEQREILNYLRQVADDYDLWPHLRLGTPIASAQWDAERGEWELATAGGAVHTAGAAVFAVGQLHRPYVPELPGRADFGGAAFHTADWDHELDLAGRDVAVIGTGSSAAQLIPHVASQARRLTVYQRTANWVLPKPKANFGPATRLLLERLPGMHGAYRRFIFAAADVGLTPVITRGWSARPAEWVARRHLRRHIADPQLRAKLTPDHPIGCKRVLVDSSFYPSLTRDNVELVTDSIASITPAGVVTSDGVQRDADVIVYATGFRTTEFLVPIEVRGRAGASLRERWTDGAEAYLGMALPEFPNMYLLHGPNTILGHNSNVYVIERQVEYVMKCLQLQWAQRAGVGLEVRPEAMESYRRWLAEAVGRTVWGACQSWYKTESGRVTNPWPVSPRRYRTLSRRDPAQAFGPAAASVR